MLTEIKINNVATYKTTVIINNLKKLNFFFGYNGSGKSTVAKFLYNLSLETTRQNNKFSSCSQNGFNFDEHQILVFNEDFTKRNFIENTTLKGVFFLNETNEEIDNKIIEFETSIKQYEKRKDNKKNIIDLINHDDTAKETNLLNESWNKRTEFNSFSKIELENKTKKSHISKIKTYINQLETIAEIEELSNEYQRLYEKDLKNINLNIDVNLYIEIRKLELTLKQLLSEVIVGNEDVDIANLIKKLNSRSWIEAGRVYLEETGLTCPFCQQDTINDEFKKQLDKIFDETYKEKIESIEKLKIKYKKLVSRFLENILNIQQIFNTNNITFKAYQSLEEIFKQNIKNIKAKVLNPNEKKTVVSIKSLKDDLSNIIKEINANNDLFGTLDTHKKVFIEKIWLYMTDRCKNDIEILDKKKEKYQRIISKANYLIQMYTRKIIDIKKEIEDLRTQTINTREAVENINNILKNSGFDGFEIEEQGVENNISRYNLKRFDNEDNEVFQTLSEGEKNFISFLYFYQLCTGTDDILNSSSKKKIIVVDDPVSSLDSRVLFIISTLIRKLIKRKSDNPKSAKKELKNENIIQVFIFTHNLYFYKEVAFDKRLICMDFLHYKITKMNNQTNIELVNQQVFDDYSLMWKSLKDIKDNLSDDKSMNIFIANTMRRIIESYVNFIGIGKNPWASLSDEDIDNMNYDIKSAFISMINDESHKIGALDNIYYQRIINEEPNVLFDIFKEIFDDIGIEHYNSMMNIGE